jgi:hypothetical protein
MILDGGAMVLPAPRAPAQVPDYRPAPATRAPYRHPVAEVRTEPLEEMRAGIAQARDAIARCLRACEDARGEP